MLIPVLGLPDELLTRIVDFLDADDISLRACALVHSRLRAPSQEHIFREIELSSVPVAVRVGALLRSTPALACIVRVVHVLVPPDGEPGALLVALDAHLPRLHTLCIDERALASARVLRPHSTRFDTRAALAADATARLALPGLASAQRLVIGHTDFVSAAELATLLSLLPRVSALEVTVRMRVHAPVSPRLVPPPPGFALTYLDLRGLLVPKTLDDFARWLCAPGSRALVRLETLGTNTNPFVPSSLLAAVAPTLKELRIRQLVHRPGFDETALPVMPALRRLSINAFDGYTSDQNATAALISMLGTCAPALVDMRVFGNIIDMGGAPASSVRWSAALAFVLDCRSGTVGALALRTFMVSLAVHSQQVPDLHAALELAEREALALRLLSDELRALPETPRLILHARSADVCDLNEGPQEEIWPETPRLILHARCSKNSDLDEGLVREILHGLVANTADPK